MAVIDHTSGGMFFGRVGDWKLVLGTGYGSRQQPKGKSFGHSSELYNVAETNNAIADHPGIAQRLEAAVQRVLHHEVSS